LLSQTPVLYKQVLLLGKKNGECGKKKDFMIAEMKQICIFVAMKSIPACQRVCLCGFKKIK
jgi:hypothetical protein